MNFRTSELSLARVDLRGLFMVVVDLRDFRRMWWIWGTSQGCGGFLEGSAWLWWIDVDFRTFWWIAEYHKKVVVDQRD